MRQKYSEIQRSLIRLTWHNNQINTYNYALEVLMSKCKNSDKIVYCKRSTKAGYIFLKLFNWFLKCLEFVEIVSRVSPVTHQKHSLFVCTLCRLSCSYGCWSNEASMSVGLDWVFWTTNTRHKVFSVHFFMTLEMYRWHTNKSRILLSKLSGILPARPYKGSVQIVCFILI